MSAASIETIKKVSLLSKAAVNFQTTHFWV